MDDQLALRQDTNFISQPQIAIEMQSFATDSTHLLDLPPHVLCLTASFVEGDKAALRSSCRCLRDIVYGLASISLRSSPKPDKPAELPLTIMAKTPRPDSDLHDQLPPHDETHGGQLHELPVSLLAKCPCLTSIKFSGTQIAWLPVSDLSPLGALTTLQSVDCSCTKVADLSPLVALESLRSLDCYLTNVANLSPLSALAALSSLNCMFTKVKDLSPLSAVTALHTLNVSFTCVQDLSPLAVLNALESLNFKHTQIFDLAPLAVFKGLTELLFGGDPTPQIIANKSSGTLSFFVGRSKVTDLTPLSGLDKLQSLYCDDTHVVDLSPLSGLMALQTLNCTETYVNDLSPLAALTGLQLLNCEDTYVRSLKPLSALTALKILSYVSTDGSGSDDGHHGGSDDGSGDDEEEEEEEEEA